jgi:hypothetical protein
VAKQPRERLLRFDIGGIQDRALRGVRRAVAFVGLTERYLEGELPRSLSLDGNFPLRMLPDPIPDELANELGSEFRQWVLRNALRELDQFLSLMLDQCWDIVEAGRIVAGHRPANYEWQRIDRQTNVAAKHRRVLEGAGRYDGPHADDNVSLVTLSSARNWISHNLGVIDVRRAPAGSMRIRWVRIQTEMMVGDRVYVLEELELPFQLPDDQEGIVQIRFVSEEREFGVGEVVTFSPAELLHIAFAYKMIIDRVCLAMVEYSREAGVQFPEP